ncbi:MAG: radical SAM protein [Acidimicrobiales bacterium]
MDQGQPSSAGGQRTGTRVELLPRAASATTKVALLRPPWVIILESSGVLQPTPPVGLAYVAATLRTQGHEVQVIDAPGEAMEAAEEFPVPQGTVRRIGLTPTEMVERIEPGTQLIGLTNMFAHEWPTVREVAELARERFPEATIILGGENATAMWTWVFEQTDAIDAVVLGEGERAAAEVAHRVAQGATLAGVEGLALREVPEGEEHEAKLPVRMRHLEEIPRPAWDLFPLESYWRHTCSTGVDRGRTLPILATRGCPYKCSFCSSPNMWTTRYIVRDPEDVADEIEHYARTYGVRNVDFVDLTPMTKRSWILKLSDELEARGLDVSLQLPIGTRSEALDEEVLRRMAAAGTTNITFAPESGSPHMLEVYDKRLDLDHVLDAIRAARRAGMITNIHMIIGHPEERWMDRWHNWTFMMRAALAGLHVAGTTIFYPYPGSRDFKDLVAAGRLTVDDAYCYDCLTRGGGGSTHQFNPQLSVKQLHLVQLFMITSFLAVSHLLHPSQLVHLIKTQFFGAQETNFIEQGLKTKRKGPMSRRRPGLPAPRVLDAPPVPLRVADRDSTAA